MQNLIGVILWSSILVTGPVEGSGGDLMVPASTGSRLDLIADASWLTAVGVRTVADPNSGVEVLIATGSARLPGALSRSSALRIAVARARMDAIRQCVESVITPGQAGGRIVIEGSNGIRVLTQRRDPKDRDRLFVTIAVTREWIDKLQVRERPASRVQTKPPVPTTQAVTKQKSQGTNVASPLIKFFGLTARTIRDAINEDPVSLIAKAREHLTADDLDVAQDCALRARRIGAARSLVGEIDDEIKLRRELENNLASNEALIRLAEWAHTHDRLQAVVEPLRQSLATLRESAGADAFVDPETFYWVGRACEAASMAKPAIEFYSRAVRYGVARGFRLDARQRMGGLQRRSGAAKERER